MKQKVFLSATILIILLLTGCIKEVYDLDKLSDSIKISPTFALPLAKGDITFADMVKPDDTIRFDNDNFVRIVLRKDSVLDIKVKDYYDFSDMVSFKKGYIFGEVQMSDFQATMPVTLDNISQYFDPALRAQFQALDDGQPHDFPSFPLTDIGERSFGTLPGFENALIKSGKMEISVRNNLTAPLNDIKIKLYNSEGHTQIGGEITIPFVNAGSVNTVQVDLAGVYLTNSIVAGIVFTGSPGASNVIIDLDQTVEFVIYAYDLKITAGRVIVPVQTLEYLGNTDTIDFDPGENIELERIKIQNGSLDYEVISTSSLNSSVYVALPSTNRAGSPVSETIIIPPVQTITGSIDFSDTEIDLGTDLMQPFNRLPVEYEIKISSNGDMINFSSLDSIQLILTMPDPDIDYMKGYFGQIQEDIEQDTIRTDLEDILKKIEGDFHLSDPSIKINYTNSFGMPFGITLVATGIRDNSSVDLNLAPFTIDYPEFPDRDIESFYSVNSSNSNLPDLVSLPPVEIRFSGNGQMNPSGPGTERNNYIFGDSRFVASLEVEVPLEFWINNLQFADTVDNFLKSDSEDDDDSPFKPENMEYFRLKINAINGFPLGASLNVMLYDSLTSKNLDTINVKDIIKPAPVDDSGKVTSPEETETIIDLNKDFFEASKSADKIIFKFTLITSGGGTKDVKIYSNYIISFNASVVAKPNLIFN